MAALAWAAVALAFALEQATSGGFALNEYERTDKSGLMRRVVSRVVFKHMARAYVCAATAMAVAVTVGVVWGQS